MPPCCFISSYLPPSSPILARARQPQIYITQSVLLFPSWLATSQSGTGVSVLRLCSWLPGLLRHKWQHPVGMPMYTHSIARTHVSGCFLVCVFAPLALNLRLHSCPSRTTFCAAMLQKQNRRQRCIRLGHLRRRDLSCSVWLDSLWFDRAVP